MSEKVDELENQLQELISKHATFQEQFKDVIYSEEEDAEKDFRKSVIIYEEMRKQVASAEQNKDIAKKRLDESRKKSRDFVKQIRSLENDINKLRKKLDLPELEPEEKGEKGFIIFKKDVFEDDEVKKAEREKKKAEKEAEKAEREAEKEKKKAEKEAEKDSDKSVEKDSEKEKKRFRHKSKPTDESE
jgi:Ran-binding protein 1